MLESSMARSSTAAKLMLAYQISRETMRLATWSRPAGGSEMPRWMS